MTDPFTLFNTWFAEAKAHASISEPTAMTLATATPTGTPSARIVLLKQVDTEGFVFFTNYQGRKSLELAGNPQAALCFYWMPLEKQVRIEGTVIKVSDRESDAYFNSRERGRQIGAWASLQSQSLESREALENRVQEIEKQYEGKPIPRPPHWGGWRLVPQTIEFWHQGQYRLHDRYIFTRENDAWIKTYLYP
ncbi:MAG: pyridoxamine 5'-phosphate oxidase [Alphaproteobacteria bacterium]|nr:pyridoxamine 5'-phosphate oxidase [Alphaproteobacteria bacterium]